MIVAFSSQKNRTKGMDGSLPESGVFCFKATGQVIGRKEFELTMRLNDDLLSGQRRANDPGVVE